MYIMDWDDKRDMKEKMVAFFVKIKSMKQNEHRADRITSIMLLLVLAMCIEMFVFNFRALQSMGNKPYTPKLFLSNNYVENEDGTYTTLEGDHWIEIKDINRELKTAYVEIINHSNENDAVLVYFDVTDTSHASYQFMNKRYLYAKEKRSMYITFHAYGEVKSLRISPQYGADQNVSIHVTLNPKIPVFWSHERVIVLFLVFLMIYYFRPTSVLHKMKYVKLSKTHKFIVIAVFFLLHAVLFLKITKLNSFYQGEYGENTEQYQKLAEAFKEGSVSLLMEPDEALVHMENPYDIVERNRVLQEAGQGYRFDHAYFNGKYYVYFGAVPCVLVYLPYYILTGEHIHNYQVVYIGMLLLLLGILLLMDELIRKYCPKCSCAVWYLLTELIVMGSTMIYILKRPDFYSIPNTYGLAFGTLGFWLIMKSEKSVKEKKELNIWYLTAGALCTALICGCRPQIFLFIVLDIIVLKDYIFNWNYWKTSNGKKAVCGFAIPMVLVATVIMAYNFVRFGSPFDFGANYNLTFNDMRFRGWNMDRLPLGIFIYLLHPMNIVSEYPYFEGIMVSPTYMGVTIQETTYGGVLWAFPFSMVGFIPFLFHKKFHKKNTLWMLSVASWIIAFIIVCVDTEMSGILARYFADFSLFIMLSAACASLMIISQKGIRKTTLYKVFVWILIGIFIWELIYHLLVFTLDSGDYLRGNRKDIFYHLYYLISFAI